MWRGFTHGQPYPSSSLIFNIYKVFITITNSEAHGIIKKNMSCFLWKYLYIDCYLQVPKYKNATISLGQY